MTENQNRPDPPDEAGTCSVVILYETDEVLSHAASLCDRLMEERWRDIDIHVNHWPFEKLAAAETASEAAADAARADVLVVAIAGEGGFPAAFLQWTEVLLGLRRNREGALVGLFAPGTVSTPYDLQLHCLALRAGMDYLNHLPTSFRRSIPDQPDWCASRAETFTGTLDDILRHEPGDADERRRD